MVVLLARPALGEQTDTGKEVSASVEKPSRRLLRLPLGKRGYLEFGGLMQGWFMNTFDDNEPYVGLGATRSTFRLRRGEVRLAGEITPEVSFKLMFDVAKVLEFGSKSLTVSNATAADASKPVTVAASQPTGRTSVLQDFNLTFKFIPYANLSMGQYKTPLSLEGLTSSGLLTFIERSEVGRIFGDQRDMGLWAWYRWKRFAYFVGFYNGAGANNLDTTTNKELMLRFELMPFDGLYLATSLQRTLADDVVGTAAFGGEKTVVGADAQLKMGGFTAQGEFYYSKAIAKDTLQETRPKGGYVSLAHLFPIGNYGLQPAVRFDVFDPDENTKDDDYWRLTIGTNLRLAGPNAMLQLNYTHSHYAQKTNDLVLLNAQISY